MRLDFIGLEAFVAIAERGSFRAAASHLNLSQTALSHRIRKLEDAVATQLLLRTTRQVMLTPAGAALLPKARRLFDELGMTIGALRDSAARSETQVAVACLPTVAMQCLPGAIAAFARLRGEVEVKVFDNSAAEIAERVRAGDAAFGITIMAANRVELEMKPVVREPFVLVCHRDLAAARFAAGKALAWADIADLPLVRVSAETGNRILIDDALGARREALTWRYEVQRVTTAISLARAGLGAAVVPQLGFDAAGAAELVAIPLRAPAVSRTLGLVTAKGVPLRPAAQQFAELVMRALKATLASDK